MKVTQKIYNTDKICNIFHSKVYVVIDFLRMFSLILLNFRAHRQHMAVINEQVELRPIWGVILGLQSRL